MDQEEGPGLSAARGHLRSAEALLRSLQPPRAARPGRSWSARWRLLRRAAEDLRRLLTGWAPAMDREESPEAGRRRRELEARSLRAESALRDLEERQDGAQRDWERVFAELERVQEGWRLLAEEGWAVPPPAGALPRLTLKADRVTTLWARLLSEQAEALRDSARLESAGRWITDVCLPVLEAKSSGAQAGALAALRRRLDEMDRRRRAAPSPAAPAAPGGADSLLSELDEARDRARSLGERLEELTARNSSEAEQALVRGNSQAAEIRGLRGKLEEHAAEAESWKALCEESRRAAAALQAASLAAAAELSPLRGQAAKLEAQAAVLRSQLEGARTREALSSQERVKAEEALRSLGQGAQEEAARLNAACQEAQSREALARGALRDAMSRAAALEAAREVLRRDGEAALRPVEERAEDLHQRLGVAVTEVLDLRGRLQDAEGLLARSRAAEQVALSQAEGERRDHLWETRSWKEFAEPPEVSLRVLRLADALTHAKAQALEGAAVQAAEIEKLRGHIAELKQAAAAQKEKAARLPSELEALKQADAAHREMAVRLHAKLKDLKHAEATQREKTARLQAELEEARMTDAAHRETAERLQAELQELRKAAQRSGQ